MSNRVDCVWGVWKFWDKTPWKINGWNMSSWRWKVQIIFLSFHGWFVGEPAVNLPGSKTLDVLHAGLFMSSCQWGLRSCPGSSGSCQRHGGFGAYSGGTLEYRVGSAWAYQMMKRGKGEWLLDLHAYVLYMIILYIYIKPHHERGELRNLSSWILWHVRSFHECFFFRGLPPGCSGGWWWVFWKS